MKYKLSEIALFNPTETLKKGTLAKKVGMDKLHHFVVIFQIMKLLNFPAGRNLEMAIQ